MDHGLTGPRDADGRLRGVTSTGAKSLGRKAWRGEGVAEPELVLLDDPGFWFRYGGVGSASIASSHSDSAG